MSLPGYHPRHMYYLACFAGLLLLHALTAYESALLPWLSPFVALLGLLLVDTLVWSRQDEPPLLVSSFARLQRSHFYRLFSSYLVIALISLIFSREVLGLSLGGALFGSSFILMFGLFASIELTLVVSRQWYQLGVRQNMKGFRLVPISFVLKASIGTVMATVLLILAVSLYGLYASLTKAEVTPAQGILLFLLTVLFYLAVMGYLLLRISRRYADNLHYIFESQFKVLRDVQTGDYSQTIPVISQGELGLFAMQLNRLLEYMLKRKDVEDLLKRVVSPEIMEKLINTDTELLKRGEERDVAILFCDIRGFTEMSEGASATEMIQFLNTFFSELADMVNRHHGMINKFMGDAILAVYAADTPNEAIDAAMNTASEITMRVRQMRLPNGSLAETGTGIHFGRVVAGTIGSEHRYEYTYLGDAVNTASRLQGLSPRLGYPIIVSVDAYEMMSGYLQAGLSDLGSHMVRGKVEPLHVYAGPNQ